MASMNFEVIQASEDARINESAFLQLHALRNSKDFDPDKAYYLEKATGGSSANAEEAVFNSLVDLCGYNKANMSFKERGHIERFIQNSVGHDTLSYRVKEATDIYLGGFTYNSTKAFHDKLTSNQAEFRNSLVSGLPFTFGANAANIGAPMPEVSTYGFLSSYELGAPTGSTLFGASEVITLLNYEGAPTNITNGATTLGQAAIGGEHKSTTYKVLGMGLSEPALMVSGSSAGYAGDNILMSHFGLSIDIAKAKIRTALMRDFYNALETASDTSGTLYVPTYKMSDIDTSLNTTFTSLFSTASGAGEFATKVLKALIAPQNKYLETTQFGVKRVVMHTSMKETWESFLTLALAGGTTGQIPAGDLRLYNAIKGLTATFGGDICPTTDPDAVDLRMLFLADPNIEGYQNPLYRAMIMIIAVAPTVMATYGGAGFTNQTLLTKYSLPEVFAHKRAMFLVGEQ